MTLILPNTKSQLQIIVLGNPSDSVADKRAMDLADHLGLRCLSAAEDDTELVLAYGETGLELHDLRDDRTRPVCIDFTKMDVRPYSRNLSRRQPLARAMGKKNKTLIDATAGLGQDALLLAAIGYQVDAIERNAVMAALLQDALVRAQKEPSLDRALRGRLSFISGDARKRIPELARADVIYLDPMYPPKRSKSALARKEMRMLRDLVGEDSDADQLFAIAHARAGNRVVVKRPQHARPLAADPDFAIRSKLVRYDVYLTAITKSDKNHHIQAR